MTWNNRIFRADIEGEIVYSLHETYYDSNGSVLMHTVEPVCGYYPSVGELIQSLEMLLRDANRFKDKIIDTKFRDVTKGCEGG